MKYNHSVYHSLSLIMQFSINMLVPIFLCSFLGMYMDKKFGTSFWFVLLFFAGAFAGFRNIFVLAKKIYERKEGEHGYERENRRRK